MGIPRYTIQNLRENIKKELAELYPDREIDSITNILLNFRLERRWSGTGSPGPGIEAKGDGPGIRKSAMPGPLTGLQNHEIGLRRHEILSQSELEWFEAATGRLKEGCPVQYITGETEFYGLTLRVSRAAMIPRPETEELVRWILESHRGERIRILDIGTGTGCIALALAKHLPASTVFATDASGEALELARENAGNLGLNVSFMLHDIGNHEADAGRTVDLIVSNPPYIPRGEKESLAPNVKDFEPESALFVPDDDPLVFYRHIAGFGRENLPPGGMLYLEIHEAFGTPVCRLLERSGYQQIELRRDINGKDRMVRARKGPDQEPGKNRVIDAPKNGTTQARKNPDKPESFI